MGERVHAEPATHIVSIKPALIVLPMQDLVDAERVDLDVERVCAVVVLAHGDDGAERLPGAR